VFRPLRLLVFFLLQACLLAFVLSHERARLTGQPGEDETARPRTDPADQFLAQRAGPDGDVPDRLFQAALGQARMERARSAAAGFQVNALTWQSVGPYNIGGRVTALAVVGNGTTAYLGSANGGVWKTANGGADWTSITDGYPFYSVGSLALDPSNPGTIYCGTGEANGSVDSYDGNGLWKSTDAGASWTNLGLASTARIARVLVDPADPTHVLVAAMGRQFSTSPDRGLYVTHDGGASWNRTLYVSDSTGVTDLVMNPVHPDTMYCATWERVRRLTYRRTSGPESGIWRSVDRGETWTRLTTGLPTPTDSVGRIALAVPASRPSTVYASITGGASLGYAGVGFYRSVDGGTTWSRRSSGGTWSSNFGGFAWYFGDIAVDPFNPDHVWTPGQYLMSSTNGGTSWSQNTSLHPDLHALWPDPNTVNHLFIGSDGGFYSSTTGTSFTHSNDLPISQFYDGDVHPTNVNTIGGGLQDNGQVLTSSGPSSWASLQPGGDGFHFLIDPVTPNVMFDEYQYCSSGAGFYRSTNSGASFGATSGWNASDRFGWDTPIAMNPLNHNVLIAGSQYVYRSTDNGVTWSKPSVQDLTTDPVSALVYGCLTTLAISNADTNVYYAGTDDGKVWRSSNRGGGWTDITAGLPARWITRVTPDPNDPMVVYVTLSGFTTDQQAALVYRSADQGASWTNISGNLPNVPANDLLVDPTDTQTLFVGTDLGVWVSRNQGGGWYSLGDGMPLQAVFDLTLQDANRQLYAFTHGRSAWRLDLAALPPAGVPKAAPAGLALSAPWPNPARNAVRISLELPHEALAEVVIYDVVGRRVATLHEGALGAGRHELAWDRRDDRTTRARAGVYFVRASVEGAIRTQRIVLAE
jgi:photosystem II stability/assembly factor-like uncharacterized protein